MRGGGLPQRSARAHREPLYQFVRDQAIGACRASNTPLKLPSRKKLSVQRKAWAQDETLVMEELAMGKTEGSVEMKVPLRMLSGI